MSSALASSREMCICEYPMRSAIWLWVISSKNRRVRTVRCCSGQRGDQRACRFNVEHLVQTGINIAESVTDGLELVVWSWLPVG